MSAANVNVDVVASGTLTQNPNSLRFNTPGAATLTIGGASYFRQILDGGILVTPAVGANTTLLTGGYIQGINRRDLLVFQNNPLGLLQIDSWINDSGNSGSSFVKNGVGTLLMAGGGYAGATVVNEGTIITTGNTSASFTRTAAFTAGTPTLTMSDTSGIFVGQQVSQATNLTSQSTYIVTAITPNTSVTLNQSGGVTAASASFSFRGFGGFGATTTGVHIAAGATAQIGNGSSTGALFAGQPVVNNGTLAFNRTDTGLSMANVISGNGTLTLTNTYAGTTTLAGGTLQIGNGGTSGSLGAGNVTVTTTGTALAFNRSDAVASPLMVNNSISGNSAAIPNIVVNSGVVQLGGATDNGWVSVDVKGGTLILAKASTSAVHSLGGAASTVENGGTLQLGTAGTGGDQIYSSVVLTVQSGDVFDLNSMSETFATLNLAGAGISSGGALINSNPAADSTPPAPSTAAPTL